MCCLLSCVHYLYKAFDLIFIISLILFHGQAVRCFSGILYERLHQPFISFEKNV